MPCKCLANVARHLRDKQNAILAFATGRDKQNAILAFATGNSRTTVMREN